MLQISELLKFDRHDVYITDRPQRFAKDYPPVIVWNINNTCNMSCPHCYASAKINKVADEITVYQAREVIDKLHDFGIRIVIFSGGEPLLREDLFELISYAHEKGLICHLSTNGTLIDDNVAQKIKDVGVGYVGISIDGLANFNDSYRGLNNGYQLALDGLKAVQKVGLQTGIRLTLSLKNSEQLFPMIQMAEKQGINRFYLSHLVYGGRGKSFAKFGIGHERARDLMRQLFDLAVEYIENGRQLSIVSGGNDADGVFLYHYVLEKFGAEKAAAVYKILKLRGGNSAGEKIINIDYKGFVHPDQFWSATSLGNINQQQLSEILQHPLIKQLKNRNNLLQGKCQRCDFKEICRGSHRERALASFSDIWQEDPACYLTAQHIDINTIEIAQ